MVIRKWRTCLCLVVLLPALIALINREAMFVLMSLLILTVCGRSLCSLVVANFASEEFAMRYAAENALVPACAKDVKVTQAAVFGINILIILYCLGAMHGDIPVFALVMAIAVSLGWIFDMARTLVHYVSPPNLEADWSIRDALLEIFLWTHNILNIVFVFVMFAVKFF